MLCKRLTLMNVHTEMEIIKKPWAGETVILRTCVFQLREVNIKINVSLGTCQNIIVEF